MLLYHNGAGELALLADGDDPRRGGGPPGLVFAGSAVEAARHVQGLLCVLAAAGHGFQLGEEDGGVDGPRAALEREPVEVGPLGNVALLEPELGQLVEPLHGPAEDSDVEGDAIFLAAQQRARRGADLRGPEEPEADDAEDADEEEGSEARGLRPRIGRLDSG